MTSQRAHVNLIRYKRLVIRHRQAIYNDLVLVKPHQVQNGQSQRTGESR